MESLGPFVVSPSASVMTGSGPVPSFSHSPIDMSTFSECPLSKFTSNCTNSPVGIDSLVILCYLLPLSDRF